MPIAIGPEREQIEDQLRPICASPRSSAGKVSSMTRRNGHIDNLACFVRRVKLPGWTDNERDVQHAISLDPGSDCRPRLDAQGRRLKVHKLPMPRPLQSARRSRRRG